VSNTAVCGSVAQSLPNHMIKTCTKAKLASNVTKNRYRDVLPCELL